jgi:hypothetical protein
VLHRQEGMDFLGREPQPWKLVLGANPLSVGLEPVSSEIPVEDDRSVEPVLQIGKVALQRGPRDAKALLKFLPGHKLSVGQQLVDLVDALHATHGGLLQDCEEI